MNNLNPQNILVKMPNWLGDLVMATPALEDLKHYYPSAKITAMCQSNVAAVLKNDPNVNEVYSYTKPSGWIHRSQHYALIESLRCGSYDLGVLLTNSFSSAYWFWRGRVKDRVGYGCNLRSWMLTKPVAFPKTMDTQHLVLTYKMLLAPLGIPVSKTIPQLYISQEELSQAKEFLVKFGVPVGECTILGINPGAAYGSAKCWLPERFISVTEKMIENPNVHVLYFGDLAGASLVNHICSSFPSSRVTNLAGKTTLRELLALIACCSLFLSNDSGPMHVAAALKIPLLALFGSTSDTCTSPYQFGKVIHKHVECSPCYKKICPIDFRCMKRIKTDEVYDELQNMINHLPPQLKP